MEVDVSSFTRYADEPGPSAGLHLLTAGGVRAMYRDERPKHPSVQLVDLDAGQLQGGGASPTATSAARRC